MNHFDVEISFLFFSFFFKKKNLKKKKTFFGIVDHKRISNSWFHLCQQVINLVFHIGSHDAQNMGPHKKTSI